MNDDSPLVCDTSVVLNLGRRGSLTELVEKLKAERQLVVPEEVEKEARGADDRFYRAFLTSHFQVTHGPLPLLAQVEQAAMPDGLDGGEQAVLALCLERKWTPGIDEVKARTIARQLGFRPVGTIGLLQLALSRHWMTDEQCLDAVRRMKASGFYCPKVLANDDFADYISRLK